EMLARLQGDDGATLAPGEFLPVAERHGLISELDSWVARRSVELLGAQKKEGRSLPRLHVNMSARSVDHPEILQELGRELARHEIPRGQLVIELTETSKLIDLDVAQRFARQLIDLGCELALDDFGAGFNSLVHLRELPLAYVKIDGSLCRDVGTSDRAAVMVQGLASTARGLGVKSVAEYVDTQPCLRRLGEIGVDYAQGFQIGVPSALTASGRPARRHVATEPSGAAAVSGVRP
ncbi:MAG: EAL domain-containing protein, partial [Solirubrobacteraceae bacterium]|nr:EAL domain-containing protein [Solirubrobacteraceae bacterium]